jgi:hypothetical protein
MRDQIKDLEIRLARLERASAVHYVEITKEELEGWLRENFGSKWSKKSGSAGVYLIHLSDSVAIKLSSTQKAIGRAVGRGGASMSLSLVSRIDDRLLNAKAKDRKHFQRTMNWRTTWLQGVMHWKGVYLEKKGFYDKIADRSGYRQKWLDLIDSIPYAGSDDFLIKCRDRLEGGEILWDNQEQVIQEKAQRASRPISRPRILPVETLRLMWAWGRDHRNERVKEVALRLGLKTKEGIGPDDTDMRDFNWLTLETGIV